MRRWVLAAVALASCDVPDPLAPDNPYDPLGGPAGRTVTGPVDLRATAPTPSSVDLAWTDRSSFEAGFEVLRERRVSWTRTEDSTLATLPPDATAHTVGGLLGTDDLTMWVVATSVDGGRSAPSDSVTLRYPRDEWEGVLRVDRLYRSSLSRDAGVLFDLAEGRVNVYDVGPPRGRLLYRASTLWREVYPVGEDAAVVVTPTSTDRYATVEARVLERAGVSSAVVLDGATPACHDVRVSASGNRVSARCYVDEWAARIWETDTGREVARIPLGATSREREALALSPDGSRVLVHGGGTLWVYRTSDGAEVWRVAGLQGVGVWGRFAGPYVVVAETRGSADDVLRVYDGSTGAALGSAPIASSTRPYDVRGDRVAYVSPGGGLRVAGLPGLERVRDVSLTVRGSVEATRLTDEGLVFITDQATVRRWDFGRAWEVVP